MKYILFSLGCLFQLTTQAQPTRRDILDHKILSVEAVSYNRSGTEMNARKNFYSASGSDSLELDNGKVEYTFKEKYDSKGRVKILTRFNEAGKVEETSEFEYGNAGYNVSVTNESTGDIIFSRYNLQHDKLEESVSPADTIYYSNNPSGKTGKIMMKSSGVVANVAIAEFNDKGLPVLMRWVDGSELLYRFTYNERGLPAELSRIRINNGQEKLILRTVYKYEFRKS